MTFKKNITNFVNNLKSNKNFTFKIKSSNFKCIHKILPKLLKHNCLSNYYVKDGYVYIQKHISSNYLTTAFVPKHLTNISYFALQSLMYKHPTTIFVVSTSVGILDNQELRNLRIGGAILFVIKPKNTL